MADLLTIIRLVRIGQRFANNRQDKIDVSRGEQVEGPRDLVFKRKSKVVLREDEAPFRKVKFVERNGNVVSKKPLFNLGSKGDVITEDTIESTFKDRDLLILGDEIIFEIDEDLFEGDFTISGQLPDGTSVNQSLETSETEEAFLLTIRRSNLFGGNNEHRLNNFEINWGNGSVIGNKIQFISDEQEVQLESDMKEIFEEVRIRMKQAYQDAIWLLQEAIEDLEDTSDTADETVDSDDDLEISDIESEEITVNERRQFDIDNLSNWLHQKLGIVDNDVTLPSATNNSVFKFIEETSFRPFPAAPGRLNFRRFQIEDEVVKISDITSGNFAGWSKVQYKGKIGYALTRHMEAV